MARYLIMQMNGGVTAQGQRIVSAAALAETHRPGISLLSDSPEARAAAAEADTTAMHYDLGWVDQTFRDGRHMLWHSGGIDGAGSLMAFFPAERVGFVSLTNLDPGISGAFNSSLQSSLVSRLFGLSTKQPALLATAHATQRAQQAELAGETRPVNPAEVASYVGRYATGFGVRLDRDGTLWLDHDIRSMPLLAHADGGYIVVFGGWLIRGRRVRFATDPESHNQPVMTIEGFESVRWLTRS